MVNAFNFNTAFNQPIDIEDTSSVTENRDNFCVPIKANDVSNRRGCVDVAEAPSHGVFFLFA